MPKEFRNMADVIREYYPGRCPNCEHSKERHRNGPCSMPVYMEMGNGVTTAQCGCKSEEGKPRAA